MKTILIADSTKQNNNVISCHSHPINISVFHQIHSKALCQFSRRHQYTSRRQQYTSRHRIEVDGMEPLTSKPFDSLEELYANLNESHLWPQGNDLRATTRYVYSGNDLCDEKQSLKKLHRDEQPRTLVCHDMKGGYLEDRFINGSEAYDSYVFYHWSFVDIFVYFSHHFVTVPPYTWINAAHRHGVKVLGTVITERESGEQIWDQIFKSEFEIKKFADTLVMVAKLFNFEGWLLNVENQIARHDIPKLTFFIKHLTEHIHEQIKDSQIIWYDSVTLEGNLDWQNELNNLNKCFFDCCDGIFLNYCWTDDKLARSCQTAISENHVKDIYVGLDVWGRGCPGGGGLESDYALKKIREHNLSVAIFGPGWTHEFFGPKTFEMVEDHFWAQLIPYLYVHVPFHDNEVFQTSFCRGAGLNYFRMGQPDNDIRVRGDTHSKVASFYNLGIQQTQPLLPTLHLQFIRKDRFDLTKPEIESILLTKNATIVNEKKSSVGQDKCEEETKIFEYETKTEFIHINDQLFTVKKKCGSKLNDFHIRYDLAFNGGAALKVITEIPERYHRLFLIHLVFECDIEVSLVWRNVSLDDDHHPVLFVRNDAYSELVNKYKTEDLNFQWKKNFYSTSFKKITEIGLKIPKHGIVTLGEIVVYQKWNA